MKQIFKNLLVFLDVGLFGTLGLIWTQDAMFYKVKEANVTMLTVDLPVTYTDLTSCAVKCLTISGSCFSFMYNRLTSQCVLGSWVIPSNVTVTLSDSSGIYTTGAFCDTSLNYTVASNGTVTACIWMSTKNVNFTMAVSSCQTKNMHLVTPKSLEKLNILTTIALKLQKGFWVGLNDMDVEDVFRWVDDGTVLDATYRKQIFSQGQPDNFNGTEDCVSYNLKYSPLNDGPCYSSYMFICEKNIFQSGF